MPMPKTLEGRLLARQRMSEAQQRRSARGGLEYLRSPVVLAKNAEARRGKPLSSQRRAAISRSVRHWVAENPWLGQKVARLNSERNCSPETRGKMSRARKGRPLSKRNRDGIRRAWENPVVRKQASESHRQQWVQLSLERKEQLGRERSIRQKAHAALVLPQCRCPAHSQHTRKETDIEIILSELVLAEFPAIEKQKKFGCYTVDVYLPPPYHLAFEADGEYWHRSLKRDAARDRYLLRKFDLPVIRLPGRELKALSCHLPAL